MRESDLKGENENLAGMGCEIQICSMMAHVWNEIEHDIGYKTKGTVGEREKEYLSRLGSLIRDGDILIDGLILANEERVSSSLKNSNQIDTELGDELAVRRALCEIFGRQRDTFHSGSLHQELIRLELTSFKKLKDLLGSSNRDWTAAQQEIRSFNAFLKRNGLEQYELAPTKSTDPALWIILKKMYPQILEKFPAGQGQGRPRRIRSLASRYQEYIRYRDRNHSS